VPIDNRDWYRQKPIPWSTSSPPPSRRSSGSGGGGGSGAGAALLVILSVLAVVAVLNWDRWFPSDASATGSAAQTSHDTQPTTSSQTKVCEDWQVTLNSVSWEGGTAIVDVTIVNLAERRYFGAMSNWLSPGPELAAIDSTGKLADTWVPTPTAEEMQSGVMLYWPPYNREFYPRESWSGTLRYELSPYSGETFLYMTKNYHQRKAQLFSLGSPFPGDEPVEEPVQETSSQSELGTLDDDSLSHLLLGTWGHGLPEERPAGSGISQRQYEEFAQMPCNENYYLTFGTGGELSCLCSGELAKGSWKIVAPGTISLVWPHWIGDPPYGLREGESLYRVVPKEGSDKFFLIGDKDLELAFWPA